MITLDHIQLHHHCVRVCTEGLNPADIFGPATPEGFRVSIWGGWIRDRDHERFLLQCVGTARAISGKAQIVAAWRQEKGTTT